MQNFIKGLEQHIIEYLEYKANNYSEEKKNELEEHSEYINVIHRRYSSMIEKTLERKLRLIGFKDEFNVVNIKTFINTNNIELTIENKPMLTIYKAIDYRTRNVLFEFTVTSSILKENDSYVLKTEILEKK